jgi:hypothetical protein
MSAHSGKKGEGDGHEPHNQRFPLVRAETDNTSLDCTPEEMRGEDILREQS